MGMGRRLCSYTGTLFALLVFIWRYINVPKNWSYVVSWPSILLWMTIWVSAVWFTVDAVKIRYHEIFERPPMRLHEDGRPRRGG